MANLYDLKRFDLNLLVIFECIYQHLSISKAAETLFITPSAVSQSLQRLRVQLNDPLFIRAGKGISPTTAAVNLHTHLAENLNQLEQTINIMGNTDLDKKFIVYGLQLNFLDEIVRLMNMLLAEPNLQVEYNDYLSTADSVEELMHYRKADIVFSATPVNNRALICEPFLVVPTLLVCRKAHPRLGESATDEQLAQERFTRYETTEPSIKQFQAENEKRFPWQKFAYHSSSIFAIVNTIHDTDLIGFIPKPLFDRFKEPLALREIKTNHPTSSITIYMIYNRSSLNNKIFTKVINEM